MDKNSVRNIRSLKLFSRQFKLKVVKHKEDYIFHPLHGDRPFLLLNVATFAGFRAGNIRCKS